jgi:protein phosphatase
MVVMEGRCHVGDMRIAYAGASDPGRARRCNEDHLLLAPESGLFAVADGLGGLEAGDLASNSALAHIETLAADETSRWSQNSLFTQFSTERQLQYLGSMIRDANNRVYDERLALGKNMATTLALVRLWRKKALIGHVGDSRLYCRREGKLTRLTADHSLVEELHRQGLLTAEQVDHSPQRHVITQALGAEPTVNPSLRSFSLTPGDLLLLCTDGLTTMISDDAINECLLNANGDCCRQMVQSLIDQANAAGGRDNITVVVLVIG